VCVWGCGCTLATPISRALCTTFDCTVRSACVLSHHSPPLPPTPTHPTPLRVRVVQTGQGNFDATPASTSIYAHYGAGTGIITKGGSGQIAINITFTNDAKSVWEGEFGPTGCAMLQLGRVGAGKPDAANHMWWFHGDPMGPHNWTAPAS
jgi:hypothetical protein